MGQRIPEKEIANFKFVEVKMIAHCMKKVKWEKIKDQTYWGHESVENEGFAEVLKCLR